MGSTCSHYVSHNSHTIEYFWYSRPSKMPLWKLMPERVVEHGEEARERQSKAALWSIVFLFFFTCSIVLIFAIIQKVCPDSILLQHKNRTGLFPRNSSISATNYNLEINVTAI